jgi:hypothetical protein
MLVHLQMGTLAAPSTNQADPSSTVLLLDGSRVLMTYHQCSHIPSAWQDSDSAVSAPSMLPRLVACSKRVPVPACQPASLPAEPACRWLPACAGPAPAHLDTEDEALDRRPVSRGPPQRGRQLVASLSAGHGPPCPCQQDLDVCGGEAAAWCGARGGGACGCCSGGACWHG